jgi:hypothetical protein
MDFLHDIFISYPSNLNRTPYENWVTKFEEKLRLALEDLSENRSAPNIYLDKWKVEANSNHDEMLERARRSKIFLAIVSPNYQERVWAPRELSSFAEKLNDWGRLFVIASKPLPEDEIRLDGLKGRPIKTFFHCQSGDARKAMPFHPDSREFADGVYSLASAMAAKLDGMKTAIALNSSPAKAKSKTILLAHATDDLEKEFRNVADQLAQLASEDGVTVLSGADYPLGGKEFLQAFSTDLARADLVVQLLSDTLGKRPRDLPDGYVLTQARLAMTQPGVKLMQWRRSNIDVDAIADPALHALLQGEAVTASTLPAFKEMLIEWVRAPAHVEPSTDTGMQVFINAERADWSAAMECRQAVADLCAAVWFPPEGNPDKESIQKEFNELLIECDSLLFLNGDAETVWVSQQLRQAIKTRAANGLKLRGAVCNGPPPGKADIHGMIRGIELLDCRTSEGSGWKFEPVRDFVIKQAGMRAS